MRFYRSLSAGGLDYSETFYRGGTSVTYTYNRDTTLAGFQIPTDVDVKVHDYSVPFSDIARDFGANAASLFVNNDSLFQQAGVRTLASGLAAANDNCFCLINRLQNTTIAS